MSDESVEKNMPLGLVAPVLNARWRSDEEARTQYESWLEYHQESDVRSGGTCWVDPVRVGEWDEFGLFSQEEFDRLLPLIPEQFKAGPFKVVGKKVGVNQHYLFSLQQFYAEVQKAWDDHVERTERLATTVQGRFPWSEAQRARESGDRHAEVE